MNIEKSGDARVFLVHLRRPTGDVDPRHDPFYEFGSFGLTGCHRSNLMKPEKRHLKDGDRLAFLQGGSKGTKILLVTPPIRVLERMVMNDKTSCLEKRLEATWSPHSMPLVYDTAPDVLSYPELVDYVKDANRPTADSQISSCFRTRVKPLEADLAKSVVGRFEKYYSEGDVATDPTQWIPDAGPKVNFPGRAKEIKRLRSKRAVESRESPVVAGKVSKGCGSRHTSSHP